MKNKYVKRGLALILAMAMVFAENAFGAGSATVWAAENVAEDMAENPAGEAEILVSEEGKGEDAAERLVGEEDRGENEVEVSASEEGKDENETEVPVSGEGKGENEGNNENTDNGSINDDNDENTNKESENNDNNENAENTDNESINNENTDNDGENSENASIESEDGVNSELTEDENTQKDYAGVVFQDKAEFDSVRQDMDLSGYDDKWREADTAEALLNDLSGEGNEYAFIIQTNPDVTDKVITIPENIKGIIIDNGWCDGDGTDENPGYNFGIIANTLNITGAETEVYLIEGAYIDTAGADYFTINFSNAASDAAGNNSKLLFRNSMVSAAIKCESDSGTIVFEESNILNGYASSAVTEFHEWANLCINEPAGISLDRIVGDTEVTIVYNGYPQKLDFLPHFNKEIDLGKGRDEESGEEYDRGVSIRFWQHTDEPFGLDGTEDWWESVPAVELEKGAQVAYFAGSTYIEKERIGRNVNYWAHGDVNNDLYLNPSTGRLEKDGEEGEGGAYRVLALTAEQFNQILEEFAKEDGNGSILWDDENGYGAGWEETDELDTFLSSADTVYVAVQARKRSHNNENKTLELPANIKGAFIVSDYEPEEGTDLENNPEVRSDLESNPEAGSNLGNNPEGGSNLEDNSEAEINYVRIPWQINALDVKGEADVYVGNVTIDPLGQELTVTAASENANIVFANSEVIGAVKISDKAKVKFIDSDIKGSVNASSNTVEITDMFIADGLTNCSKLIVNGCMTFIVRNPEQLIFNDIELIKVSEYDFYADIVYNGYPEDAAKLPVFNKPITGPADAGIGLRFVQKGDGDKDFWDTEGRPEGYDWWSAAQDEILTAGMQAAQADAAMTEAEVESLLGRLWYNTHNEQYRDNMWIKCTDGGRLIIAQHNPETDKEIVGFYLSIDKEKIYDGSAFEVTKNEVGNNCGYTGEVNLSWKKADTPLDNAPKDAGGYVLNVSVPEDTDGFEGSTDIGITILRKPVTVSIKRKENRPSEYDIVWDGFINEDTYVAQAEITQGEEQTDAEGTYRMTWTMGGDAGGNYAITHADPVRITVIKETENKPVINSVLFPKKKDSYSAVYTGEQLRPAMVVAYKYTDENGRAKTQTLKLNVDYTLSYSDNVDAGENTATVTVKGIGEYSGEIERQFTITPKSIKKVTLSPVGDIVYSENPVDAVNVVVMDGNYELVKDKDYEVVLSTNGSAAADTQSVLTVKGIGNYNETSTKSAKFNILKTGTEIKSIAAGSVTVEFKKLPAKGYTYNGKPQKPAVVVKDGGTKVPSSQYKVVYTNNINAGTGNAEVRVVGISNKGKGYYGVSAPLKFDIKQKDFSKVSVSSIAAIPKTGTLDGVTVTVKDGKHILIENVDYTIDYSKIVNADGTIKSDVAIGQKYDLTLKPVSGGNYIDTSQKIVKVKFGQLNLASKTAKVSVKIKNAASNEVEVSYNGVLLTKDQDYTATVKQDRNKSTYTVTIKAVKNSAYKGKRTVKNLIVEQGE